MDPNACLERIIDAKLFNDIEELHWACEDLYGWIHRGGFHPNDRFLLDRFEEVFDLPFSLAALAIVQSTHGKK